MVPTKVMRLDDTSKLKIDGYFFRLHDNAFDVLVYDDAAPGEDSWTEMVKVEEIEQHVVLPNGMVDISRENPVTGYMREQLVDFDFFMAYEFDNCATSILSDIIRKRYKKEAA